MALSIFPAQTVSLDLSEVSKTQKTVVVPSLDVAKTATVNFTPGVYVITCVSSTNATVIFYDSSLNVITTATTVSGTVTVNLGTTATKILCSINTGSNINVNFTVSGATVATTSGTLDTVSASGSYTVANRCRAYIVAVSGGQGGRNGESGYYGGDGGNSGGVTLLTTILEAGTYAVTIGAGTGPYPPSQSQRPIPGTTLMTLNGTTIIEAVGPNNNPAPGGAWGGFRSNGAGGTSIATDVILRSVSGSGATTGGGRGGIDNGTQVYAGGGNGGLGTGGAGGGYPGTGFGGGGGGGNQGGGGGSGSNGGIYIMRF